MSGNVLEVGGICHPRNQMTPCHSPCCESASLWSGDMHIECSASTKGTLNTRSYVRAAQQLEVAEGVSECEWEE